MLNAHKRTKEFLRALGKEVKRSGEPLPPPVTLEPHYEGWPLAGVPRLF